MPPRVDAAIPTTAGLTKALGALGKDPWLGPSVGISVRDGLTGKELYAVQPSVARAPASTLKLLSTLAVTQHVDLDARMTTKVVTGDSPTQIVLVAGGDTLLGDGASNPSVVEGRAGIATLADQVAQSLTDRSAGAVTLRIDATYAAGPRYPATWKKEDIAAGFSQSVSMLDLVSQRAGGGKVAPSVPEAGVAAALAKALTARGHATTVLPLVGHGHGRAGDRDRARGRRVGDLPASTSRPPSSTVTTPSPRTSSARRWSPTVSRPPGPSPRRSSS